MAVVVVDMLAWRFFNNRMSLSEITSNESDSTGIVISHV